MPAIVLVHPDVIRLCTERSSHLGQGARVSFAVLAEVETGEMKVEAGDLAHQSIHGLTGVVGAVGKQRVPNESQVVLQPLPGPVDSISRVNAFHRTS